MTPVDRDQAFKHHALRHMEEELTRKHEKNAIHGKKIARRVLHKCHVTISWFWLVGGLANVDILTTAPFSLKLKARNWGSSLTQNISLRKSHFSQPWRGHFPHSNSQLISTCPKISIGVFKILFEAWEGIQIPLQDEVRFQKCCVFTVLSHHFQMMILRDWWIILRTDQRNLCLTHHISIESLIFPTSVTDSEN
jgi:hypothetical protein